MAPKEFDLTKTSEEEVNILVLGETQSGKSTFIEAVRSYADPTHNTDNSTIGTGVHSHTNDVLQYKLHSNLPQYKAFPSRSGIRNTLLKLLKDEDPINYRQALCESALEDFEDILYDRKATLSRETFISESQKYKFNICDTPGLNDSDFQDEIHVANILRRVKKLGKIHQVLVMIPPVVFTPGFISAIKTYVELLPEFCDIMAFVHTRISYTSLHPENDGHISTLSARVKLLGEIIGRDSAPHFLIDSQLDLLRPVQKCITMNTIRDVLWTARFNQPVSFLASLISKTKKMRDVDSVVCDNVSRAVKSIEKTMLSLNAAEGRELGGVLNARLYIQHLSLARQKIRYELELLESNDFCLTSETLWNQWWETPQWRGTMETKINEADQTVLLYQQSAQQLTFTNRMMRMENGDMISLTQHHEAKNGHGFRHIRLYKRRRELHKDRVIMLKRSQEDTEAHLRKAEHWCNDQSNCRVGTAPSAAMQLSLMKYSKCISLVDRLSLQYLSLTDFRRLAVSRAYMGDLVECACLVEEYYQRQYETVKTPVAFGPVPMQANTSIQGLGSSQNGRSGPDKQARTYRDRVSEIGSSNYDWSASADSPIKHEDLTLYKESFSTSTHCSEINNLIFGELNSGKSTIIEAVRSYVDPTYRASCDVIRAKVRSCSGDDHKYELYTDLPQYMVYSSRPGTGKSPQCPSSNNGDPINYRQALYGNDYETFEDILHNGGSILSSPLTSKPSTFRFNIFDTPGLNDVNFQGELHAVKILEHVKKLDKLHQILVMAPPTAVRPEFVTAIKTYKEKLPDFCDIMAFVHNQINYAALHPDDKDHAFTLLKRMEVLEQARRRERHKAEINGLKERKDEVKGGLKMVEDTGSQCSPVDLTLSVEMELIVKKRSEYLALVCLLFSQFLDLEHFDMLFTTGPYMSSLVECSLAFEKYYRVRCLEISSFIDSAVRKQLMKPNNSKQGPISQEATRDSKNESVGFLGMKLIMDVLKKRF
ncbi:hypothetical protein BGW38_007786 [Lunasporangiospora selenospora]|uniref:G domain-containing protein n=1 Tax=Lunasporangiospora selenospora TaxID=979761 RepID=A0A9P6KGR7_9FUNG|nr:hypothetical protein BGW38_007786 [Lunasporangiospora selenospora]